MPDTVLHLLVRGWTKIPHSYAHVNVNQMLALSKLPNIVMYKLKDDPVYFNSSWSTLMYTQTPEIQTMLDNTRVWKPNTNTPIDVVYNITFPPSICVFSELKNVHQVVFFTSEFQHIDASVIHKNILSNPRVSFVTPSEWSQKGFCKPSYVVPHGIDASQFYADDVSRTRLRRYYKYKPSDIVMLLVGCMSMNKGIYEALGVLFYLVIHMKQTHYYLFLKGSDALYNNASFANVQNCIRILKKQFPEQVVMNVIQKHVIYVSKIMSTSEMKDIYNMSDMYVCPFKGEAFNIPILEALACQSIVIAPDTGVAAEIKKNLDDPYKSRLVLVPCFKHALPGKQGFSLVHNIELISSTILQTEPITKTDLAFSAYSWDTVVKALLYVLRIHRT